MNSYQELIAKSRYARHLPELGRRENWGETTDRWIDFFQEENADCIDGDDIIWSTIRDSMFNLKSLPSMRSVMTAGEALRRTNVAAYNCAYLPVDDTRSFDEAMYILLCGTGVGFSSESTYLQKLPVVPINIQYSRRKHLVEDSKEGWCHAFRDAIESAYQGELIDFDVREVRPAGAPLKVFGGRASGPAPLLSLLHYFNRSVVNARGRRLTNNEAHDIMCKIGEVVVVGGVRRSAMISLGDLNDDGHATAKAGEWYLDYPERALANNSAVYNSKPPVGDFMREWLNIYNSKSGERGIFNREASQKQAAKWGRRDYDVDYGTNPCSEIILRPYQFCNLSTSVIRADDTLQTMRSKVEIAAIMGTMQSKLTYFPYLREIWTENTKAERLLGVSMTGPFQNSIMIDGDHNLNSVLNDLRIHARVTNEVWAKKLGISESAAITCIKPEGTVSELVQSFSGLHAGHAPYYIRRIRQDRKDPITQFLIDQKVPHEPCVMKPNDTMVFSFPMKAEGLMRKDLPALKHLGLWLAYQRHYCEHKPSVTISVKEEEWPEVGAWVYKNFDECTGVSFLPEDGGTYKQMPYEEITEEVYKGMLEATPTIDWDMFREEDDQTIGSQTLSCVAGQCEL
jgi:ribonucleoside-triphosphate reductase